MSKNLKTPSLVKILTIAILSISISAIAQTGDPMEAESGDNISVTPEVDNSANTIEDCSKKTKLELNQTCRTSQGALVKKSKNSGVAGIEIDGQFWSAPLKDGKSYSYFKASDIPRAQSACKKLGLELPNARDFEKLKSQFENENKSRCVNAAGISQCTFTQRGIKEFETVMPDAKGRYLVSSTPDEVDPNPQTKLAYSFFGDLGVGGFYDMKGYDLDQARRASPDKLPADFAIRCVANRSH